MSAYLNAFKDQLWSSPLWTNVNYVVLAISFVLFLIKKVWRLLTQLMSIVQLISASQKIVAIDIQKRK